MTYYFSADGTHVEGPVGVEELRALIDAGGIGRETPVCADGGETWQALAVTLPQLFTVGRRPSPPSRSLATSVTRAEVGSQIGGRDVTRAEANESLSLPPAAIPGTGSTFAGYRLLRALRVVSGEAELWEAEYQGERRVLKIYHRGVRPKAEVVELMQSLEPEHVVRIYETGEVDGRFYEVQELIEHGSLADLTKVGGVAEGKAREILRELAAALEHLHGRKPAIMHRDIKPANVLVRSLEPLNLVLTDFGIASAAELSQHMTSVSRTAAYAAPEALQGTVSKASDWWSVGVMLAELVTGRHPYAGLDEHAINFQIVTRGVPILAEVPERWRPLLQGLLTRDPAKRWGLVEVRQWLEGATNIPVHVEAPLTPAGAGATATHRPYKFGGKEYYEAAALGEALAKQWDEAVKHLGRGYIAKWVEEEIRDASLASALADVVEDKQLDPEQRLAVALLAMAPQLPLTWRGDLITREWTQLNAPQAKRLLNSNVPQWLERLRSECWLSDLDRFWQVERNALRQLIEPAINDFDFELGEELLLRGEEALLAEASRQAAGYGGSKNATIDRLLIEPEWNKVETVAFLACRRELLLPVEEVRRRKQCRSSFAHLVCVSTENDPAAKNACEFGCAILFQGEAQPTFSVASDELTARLAQQRGNRAPECNLTSEQQELLAFAEGDYLIIRGARPGGESARIELRETASGNTITLRSSCRDHLFPYQAGESVRISFCVGGIEPRQIATWAPVAIFGSPNRSVICLEPLGFAARVGRANQEAEPPGGRFEGTRPRDTTCIRTRHHGVIARWLKQDRDPVQTDEPLLELQTDMETVKILAQRAGVLRVAKSEGETVYVSEEVGRIAEGAGAQAEQHGAGPTAENSAPEQWLPACVDSPPPPTLPPVLTGPNIEDPAPPKVIDPLGFLPFSYLPWICAAVAAFVLIFPVRVWFACEASVAFSFLFLVGLFSWGSWIAAERQRPGWAIVSLCVALVYFVMSFVGYLPDQPCSTPRFFWFLVPGGALSVGLLVATLRHREHLKAAKAELERFTREKAEVERKRLEATREFERTRAEQECEFAVKHAAWQEEAAARRAEARALVARMRASLPEQLAGKAEPSARTNNDGHRGG